MLSDYLCIFTTIKEQMNFSTFCTTDTRLQIGMKKILGLLVKCQWFQRDERDDSIAQRFAKRTQVLPILQVNDQLCVEPVPGRILNGLKISEWHRR